jgi:hypothetical protein
LAPLILRRILLFRKVCAPRFCPSLFFMDSFRVRCRNCSHCRHVRTCSLTGDFPWA